MKNSRSLIALSFALLNLTFSALGSNSSAENMYSAHISLSTASSERALQLSVLKSYDIAGVNLSRNVAVLVVSSKQLEEIKKLGFSVTKTSSFLDTDRGPKGYTPPQKVVETLFASQKKYPQLIHIEEIGKSTEKRPLYAISLSSDLTDNSRPVVFFNAMHHAREVMTTEVVLHMIKVLSEGFGNDDEITRWLQKFRVVIVPQVNPDGNNLVHEGKAWWRKNTHKSPRVVGVDLNRNYPELWNSCKGSSGDKSAMDYRGPSPASEPETKAMMGVLRKYMPVTDISYHSFGELVMYPFGCADVKNSAQDLFFSLGVQIAKETEGDNGKKTSYGVGPSSTILYEADGTDQDWQWKQLGILSFTMEVNDEEQNFQPDYDTWRDITVARQVGGWKQLFRRLEKSGVRASVITPQGRDLSYKILVQQPSGVFSSWSNFGTGDHLFPLRENGLIYMPLKPGAYQIVFLKSGKEVFTKKFEVLYNLVDLGDLQVQ